MTNPVEKLLNVIQCAVKIVPTTDGVAVSYMERHTFVTVSVPYAELALLDPRLPEVIPAMLAASQQKDPGTDWFEGAALRATLGFWKNPQFLIDDTGARLAYTEMAALHVDDYRSGDHAIGVGCTIYTTQTLIAADGTTVEFAIDARYEEPSVSTQWLTVQYPGWERRLSVAMALGYEDKELINAVLAAELSSQAPVELGALCDADNNTPTSG